MTRPAILVVADELPWPPTAGGRLRLQRTVRGLAAAGDVTLLTVLRSPSQPGETSGKLPLERVRIVDSARTGHRPVLRWLVQGLPRTVSMLDWSRAAAALAEEVAQRPPALTWFHHSECFAALGQTVPGKRVVDVDNLEASLLRQRRRVAAASAATTIRSLPQAAADRFDACAWDRLLPRMGRLADAVVLCSALDVRRSGLPDAAIVPNGYEPTGPVPLDPSAAPPRLVFVGSLDYQPNTDAVRWFCESVLPELQRRVPDLRLDVAGRSTGGQLDDLAERWPGTVRLLGEVPNVRAFLTGAAAALAPLRIGGGTRLKILEAFAYGVPVVATTLGCEGIEARGGRDLLVADDARGLADACARLLLDPEVRRQVGQAGHEVWRASYGAATAEAAVTDLAARLLAERDMPGDNRMS